MRVAVLMVLDTSAIIATITNEQDSSRFRAAMLGAESLLMSSVAVLETRIVLFARLGLDAVGLFEDLLENAGIVVVPLDDEMTPWSPSIIPAQTRESIEGGQFCGWNKK